MPLASINPVNDYAENISIAQLVVSNAFRIPRIASTSKFIREILGRQSVRSQFLI